MLQLSGATQNNYLYTGEQYDPNVGFYYLRARYYIPSVGRFLTQDTWPGLQFEPMSLHKYLYSRDNGVNYSDPSGYSYLLKIAYAFYVSAILYTAFNLVRYALTGKGPEHLWTDLFIMAGMAGVTGTAAYGLSLVESSKYVAAYQTFTFVLMGVAPILSEGPEGLSAWTITITMGLSMLANGYGDKVPISNEATRDIVVGASEEIALNLCDIIKEGLEDEAPAKDEEEFVGLVGDWIICLKDKINYEIQSIMNPETYKNPPPKFTPKSEK